MGKPKGKTPSLLTMSTGKPVAHQCGRATDCGRCGKSISKGTPCFQIPKMKHGFTVRPIFCGKCVSDIVEQTKIDIASVEEALAANGSS